MCCDWPSCLLLAKPVASNGRSTFTSPRPRVHYIIWAHGALAPRKHPPTASQHNHEPPPVVQVPQVLVLACIALTSAVSGALSALFLLPAQRAAQCIASSLHPPASLLAASGSIEATTMPLQPPPWAVLMLVAWEAAPVLSLLLWVTPVAEGLLGLRADQRAMAQGVALMLVGAALPLVWRMHAGGSHACRCSPATHGQQLLCMHAASMRPV